MNNLPAEDKKNNLISRSKGLIDSAVSGLKGRDMNALVDEFTQEMTVVAEGLSEDLIIARQELAQLSAAQTISESERKKDMLDLQARIMDIEKRMDNFAKQKEKQDKKHGTLSSVLKQVTNIAAIIAGAWVLTAILKLIGR